MRRLGFAPASPEGGVREARWTPCSRLDAAHVYAVADAVREDVAARLGRAIEVFVHAPVVASEALLAPLLVDAEIFEIDGAPHPAWLVVEAEAARRLVAAAFGESEAPVAAPSLSALERQTLRAILADVARRCAPLTGPARDVVRSGDVARPARARTLVALRFGAPLDVEVDLLLARDPSPPVERPLDPRALDDARVAVRAIAGELRASLAQLAGLEIGAVLPMSKDSRARLAVGRTTLAYGDCGVVGGRLAFRIDARYESRGA